MNEKINEELIPLRETVGSLLFWHEFKIDYIFAKIMDFYDEMPILKESYRRVVKDLMSLYDPYKKSSHQCVLISGLTTENIDSIGVYPKHKEQDEVIVSRDSKINLDWEEWLPMEIYYSPTLSRDHTVPSAILAHILWQLTYWGFTNPKNLIEKINYSLDLS